MSARWLMVGNDLRMTCFVKRRTTGGIEVTVAVREWDDIITSIPESNPRFVINRSTQQHRRASIRQAMLDLKLRNRNADQHELQLLKQRGVLGTRAPSGTLINAEDMRQLLLGFGHTGFAERLRSALDTLKRQEGGSLSADLEDVQDPAGDTLMIDVPQKSASSSMHATSANEDSPPVTSLTQPPPQPRPNRTRKPSAKVLEPGRDASKGSKRPHPGKHAEISLSSSSRYVVSDVSDSSSDSDRSSAMSVSESENEVETSAPSKRRKNEVVASTVNSSNTSPQSGAVFLDMLLEAISYLPGDDLSR